MTTTEILADYLTQEQLADQLDVSTRTLDRWNRLGTGPVPTKVGIKTLYHREDVARWLKGQRRELKPERARRAAAARQPIQRKTARR